MSFFDWARWLRSKHRPGTGTIKKPKAGRRRLQRQRLDMELLEDRTAPAVLPAPLVNNAEPILVSNARVPGSSPSLAQNPVDPNELIEVHVNTAGTAIVGSYSTDGGASWTNFFNPVNEIDISTNARYAFADHPTVTIDRGENVYITAVQHDANNTTGALVFYRSSTLGAASSGIGGKILHRWLNSDPVYNPVVAVDNNVNSYTDSATGQSVTDTQAALQTGGFSKGLYVAWNTNDTTPNPVPTGIGTFNPNVIRVIGSSDGGGNFTSPQIVNQEGYFNNNETLVNAVNPISPGAHYATPQIVFSQGAADGQTAPGQLIFVWNDFGSNHIHVDASQPDNGNANDPSPDSVTFAGSAGGTVTEASARVESAAISNAGSGYAVSQILTVVGNAGTIGTAATLRVTAIGGSGDITGIAVQTPGAYTVRPANAVSVTGGTGSGATFNLTYQNNTADLAATTTYTNTVSITDPNFRVHDLEVTLNLIHAQLHELQVELESPGGVVIILVHNRTNQLGQTVDQGNVNIVTSGNPAAGVPAGRANFGVLSNGNGFGTTFSDNAARLITDNDASVAPYTARFRPEGGSLMNETGIVGLLGADGGISGAWTLRIIDHRNNGATAPSTLPTQRLDSWSLRFSDVSASGYRNGGFGEDQLVRNTNTNAVAVPVPGAFNANASNPYSTTNLAALGPSGGIGPNLSVAIDNTLGSFSPYQGRLYIAYSARSGSDTNIGFAYRDFTGSAADRWTITSQLNDDDASDNFSEGNRPQFTPNLAVDLVTGTLVASYYDSRYDAALTRVATAVTASIDGGQSFSEVVFANQMKTALDGLDFTNTITIEPIPSNQTGQFFGDRQGLVAHNGRIIPVFSGNQNDAGAYLMSAIINIAQGPRIDRGDGGPVASLSNSLGTFNPVGADGRRTFKAFEVAFDRPIDPITFDTGDVTVIYRDGHGTDTQLLVASVSPIDGPSFSSTFFGGTRSIGANLNGQRLATRFLVELVDAQTGPGTYRYIIGSNIADLMRTALNTGDGSLDQNFVDQNNNGDSNEGALDQFVVPASGRDRVAETLPLMLSGPFVTDTSVPVNPSAADNLVLNGVNNVVDVTFDRDILPSSFTPVDIIQMMGLGGPVPGPFTVTPLPIAAAAHVVVGGSGYTLGDILTVQGGTFTTPAALQVTAVSGGVISAVVLITSGNYSSLPPNPVSVTGGTGTGALFTLTNRVFRIGFNPQALSGTYSILVGPNIEEANEQQRIVIGDANTGFGNNTTSVTFSFNGTQATAPLAYSFGNTTPLAVQNNLDTIPALTGSVLVSGPIGGPYTVTFIRGLANQEVPNLIAVDDFTYSGPTGDTPTVAEITPQLDIDRNAGLQALGIGTASAATTVQVQFPSPNIPVTLNSGQTVTSSLTINDIFAIQQSQTSHIQLQLKITHDNIPDLEAQLIAPDGTTIQLFNGVGVFGAAPNANMDDTILDDFATNLIQNASTPIPAGPFTPQLPLSVLNGKLSNGAWTLAITNHGSLSGTLDRWTLFLPKAAPSTGMGEPIADRFSTHFRIFTQDPANELTTTTWTAVGPAAHVSGVRRSSRIGGITVDPSDPSGNTVFVAGASGGVWKTNNFLTNDAIGPTWIPLTDFGPTFAINVGSIAVFGRSNDPNQSIVFVATGEGDTGTPGVGLIRSMDGGRTWQVLSGRNNVDVNNPANPADPDKIAKMVGSTRTYEFVGLTAFKVIVDPQPQPNGQVAVYAAFGHPSNTGTNQGVWRSLDTGRTWTQIRAGFATDVVLASGSRDAGGNLDKMYAAFLQQGVFFTASARSAASMSPLLGNPGVHPLFRDVDQDPDVAIPVSDAPGSATPAGSKGRIVLAVPPLVNEPLKDTLYQGYVYALVVASLGGGVGSTAGGIDAVYMSKDFGQNWTRLQLPIFGAPPSTPTNNESRGDYNILGNQGNYDLSLVVDPNDPNVIYVGGQAADGGSVIRVDVTTIGDPYALVPNDNSDPGAGPVQFSTTGAATLKTEGNSFGTINPDFPFNTRPGSRGNATQRLTNANPSGYYNLLRDPDNPFETPSSIQFTNVSRFNNLGDDVSWTSFTGALNGSVDQHEIAVMKDPSTGLTRVIFGDDSGIYSGVGRPDEGVSRPRGTRAGIVSSLQRADGTTVRTLPNGTRNGNLQISQFYYGAAQPSVLAADLAGAMFYGMAQDTGFPQSTQDIITTGNLTWTGSLGDGAGVATDQTGSGTVYEYHWPCCGASPLPTDFLFINPPGNGISDMDSRTTGLVQPGDNPGINQGQWPLGGEGNFAINPIDGTALVISGPNSGRIFRTVGPSTGSGKQWFEIGSPTGAAGLNNYGDVDNFYKKALAFGAPSSAVPGATSDFIYAGGSNGRVLVTYTGGGPQQWRNISTGISGAVQAFAPNPRIDSKEVYAATSSGVFWLQDSGPNIASPTWVNITNGLFSLTAPVFGLVADQNQQLRYITSLVADWRYAIPDDLGNPTGPTHPVLYVAGEGGVFRSIDKGVTWVPFPNGTNERQLITIAPTVTDVEFTYAGDSAGFMAFDPTVPAAAIQTQLELIPALAGNIVVTGAVGGPYTVTFINGLAKADIVPITVNPSGIVPAGEIVTIVEITRGIPQGGYLPNAHVRDLDLVLGNIDRDTGFPNEAAGLNMLVATTYGRGTHAIRLDNSDVEQYVVSPRFGPRVVSAQNGPVGSGGIDTTWSGPVDKVSFTTVDLVQNERQTVSITDPTEVTFDFNAVPATSALLFTAATTALQMQDHLVTIPALFTNEQQSILIPSSVATVTFSYNSIAATAPLSYSPATTALDVQIHLELIPALLGNIVVTGLGTVADPFLVEFINALHGKDIPALTADNGAVVINEPRKGGPNIRVTGPAGGPFDVTFIHGLAGQDVPQLNPNITSGGPVTVVQTLQGSVPARMLNPSGNAIVPVNIIETSSGNPNPHNAFRILLPGPFTPGFYSFTLGPNISDFSGNKMDQDRDVFLKGEISDDMFSGRVLYQNFTNNRPTLTPGLYPFLPDIVEDDFTNPGTDLAAFVASLGDDIDDPDDGAYGVNGAPRGIAVTGVDNSKGRWQYAIDVYDSNPLWFDFGTPTAAAARLLEASSATRIRFVPDPDFAGTATFNFEAWDLTAGTPGGTLNVSAAGVASSSYSTPTNGTTTAIITVTAVNDAPVNILPATQTTPEETTLILSTANGNAIAVSDVDDADNLITGDEPMQVTLTVTAGVLTLDPTNLDFGFAADANGAPAGDGTADATMTFRGTLADINAALDGLAYLPNVNFVGNETLTILTNDLGNFGVGTALADSDGLTITVTQVNDAPVNTVPGAQTTDEDTPLTFSSGTGNAIVVADVDDNDDGTAGNEPMQVTLTVGNGTLSLSGTVGLIFVFSDANGTGAGDGTADPTMTFRGNLADINAALNGLIYAPTTNYNGSDTLTITTNDRGNFGTGGALTDTDTVDITVTPINDAPLLDAGANPALTAIAEDTGNPAGDTVASIIVDGSITEVPLDNAPVEAIAVTAVDTANGFWEYSTDGGSNWIDFGAPSDAAARLLGPADLIRFIPSINFNGTATFTFRAWDMTSGSAGAAADTTVNGGITAFSANTDTASITVTPVNDAPLLDASASPALAPVAEDTANPPGSTVAAIIVNGSITEVPLDNAPVEAIAVIGVDDTNGVWQFSTNGGTSWTPFGTPSVAAARLLTPTNLIRFIPATNFNGTATFTFRAWDMTDGATGGSVADTSLPGGITPFSIDTDTASVTVTPVNDAPLLDAGASPVLTAILEDATNSAGNTVADIVVDGSITEVPLDNAPVEAIAVIGVDNSNGVWQFSTNGGSTWTSFGTPTVAVARLLGPTNLVRLVPNINYNGSSTFTFRAWDMTSGAAGATANTTTNGGITAFSTATDTASITITPVNDAPLLNAAASPVLTTIAEDSTNPAGDTVAAIVVDGSITEVPLDNAPVEAIAVIGVDGNGDWQYSTDGGGSWASFGTPTAALARLLGPADMIRLIPNTNFNGTATFTFRAWDVTSGSAGSEADTTINGGTTAFSAATDTAAITVTPVNDAPLLDGGASPALTPVLEDSTNPAGDTVAAIVVDGSITEVPFDNAAVEAIAVTGVDNSNGVWQFSINGGSTWTAFGAPSDAAARLLAPANLIRFMPAPDFNGTSGFSFRAWDMTSDTAGSVADVSINGGTTAFSTATGTANIVIVPVNDAPLLDAGASPSLTAVPEDSANPAGDTVAAIVVDGSITEVPLDNAPVEAIAVIGVDNTNGDWQYSTDGGSSWASFGAPTVAAARLLGPTDMVRFVPSANYNGSSNFSFRAWDMTSGTAGSTADTSVNGGTTAFSTATDTASVTITPVNDAPILDASASPTLTTIAEDATNPAGDTVAAIVVDGSITEIPLDNAPVEAIAVVGVDNTNGDWQYSTNGGGSWTSFGTPTVTSARLLGPTDLVRFVPSTNYNGTSTFTFRAWDMTSGAAGDTANTTVNGGSTAFSTATDTASITITPVNDAPLLDAGASPTLTAILEDVPNLAGDTVAAIIVNGSITEVPLDNPAVEAIAVIGVDNSNGTWQYSINGGGAWTAFGAPSVGAARLLDSTNLIRFIPNTNFNGAATFTFRAWDMTLGTAGSTADTTINGGITAFSTTTDTASITITPVNDEPVRTSLAAAPVTANEDSANLTSASLNLGSLNYAPGPASAGDELATQSLSYQIDTIPSIVTIFLADGTTQVFAGSPLADLNALRGLRFKTVPNANGSGVLTWTVTDNEIGSPAPNDNSLTDGVTINITPVNDAPTFNLTPATSSNEDAPLQTVNGFASAMSAGPPNESGQSLVAFTLTQTATTGGLTFATAPSINVLTGTLTYRAAANANGTATYDVVLTDNGSNASPNDNSSDPLSFTITVVAVNDAPSFSKGPDQIVPKNSSAQSVTGWATAISEDQGLPTHQSEQSQALDFIVNASNPGLFSVQPAIDALGNLTYTPLANASGASSVTVQLHDDGGIANGGSDTSAAQTFNISVTDGTTTILSTSSASSVIGESVTLSALVTSNNPTNLIPDGTVTFVDTTNSITLAANVPLNTSGRADIVVNSLVFGAHTLTATYNGSSGFTGSSDTEAHQVNSANTALSLSSSVSSTILTQNVTFTATVTVNAPGSSANVATVGNVEFFDVTTGTLLMVVPLAGGQAQFSTSSLGLGDHTIRATFFSGNSNFNNSPPDTELHTVNPNPVVFIAMPASVKSGNLFTVVVYFLKNGVPDANFNGPISLAVNSGTPGGGIIGQTVVNASGGIATFSGIRIDRAGTYTFKAGAAGLPEVISSPIDITAILLTAQVSPRILITNRPITMVLTAQDITGQPAPNFNGPFLIRVLKKPAGARVINRFGIFNGGIAVLSNLRVSKAGTYKFQITINGLTLTKSFVIRGRRSSSRPA